VRRSGLYPIPTLLSFGDHHDAANLQIAPNDTPGLSLRTQSGEWIDASNSPGTFVVKGGQLLQRRTNDYSSPPPNRSGGDLPRRWGKATIHPLFTKESAISALTRVSVNSFG
jgi:hypothetical protein